MRVGLDGWALGLARGTGVTTYARNLSHALRDLGVGIDVLYGEEIGSGERPALESEFFDSLLSPPRAQRPKLPVRIGRALRAASPFAARAREIPVRGAVDLASLPALPAFDRLLNASNLFVRAHQRFRYTGRLLEVVLDDPPEIFHWTYPMPARVRGSLNVYTLLDLIPIRLPHVAADDKSYYLKLLSALCARADLIVTLSKSSRRDIETLLGPVGCPVVNTYASVRIPADVASVSALELERMLASAFGLRPRGYYIYVGAVEPRKNLPRLLEGYFRSAVERPLVVAGPSLTRFEGELGLAPLARRPGDHAGGDFGEAKSGKDVLRLDYLDARQLLLLVRGARALVFPSLYEGLGLPVLEAMSLGTPVITSSTTSLAEIGGTAVLRVDPLSIEDILKAFEQVDSVGFDFERAGVELRAEAAKFSPQEYERRLASAYRRVLPEFGISTPAEHDRSDEEAVAERHPASP